ncbi:transcription repressor OFP14-like [Hevea brasiliensis]|uniref:transcription repressor OFP14-like n=1 Tax=Hevea brasiliensis TaxID=3981 RepID=UPI0025E6ECC9|nr:transcription repressor OFP14-like [Hevea brasiliensis]
MPTKLQKSLLAYLSKIKNPTPPNSLSSSKNWVLSGCKNPKTPSFATDRSLNEGHEMDGAATLSDIDRFLFENFKSLYIRNEDHRQKKKGEEEEEEEKGGGGDGDYDNRVRGPHGVLYHDHYDSPRFFEITPDLCWWHRFFVTAGSSSLLIEEARLSLTVTSEEGESSSSSTSNTIIDSARSCSNNTDIKNINVALPDDCITVIKYSRSPNEDFQQSMQEMVEARLQRKGKVDWDLMQELLFCYLDLNEKKSHKFILSALVDLVVGLRQSSGEVPAKPRRCYLIH